MEAIVFHATHLNILLIKDVILIAPLPITVMMPPNNVFHHVQMEHTVMSSQFNAIVCLVQTNVCYVRVPQKTSAGNF
jgi:hypothetical protein